MTHSPDSICTICLKRCGRDVEECPECLEFVCEHCYAWSDGRCHRCAGFGPEARAERADVGAPQGRGDTPPSAPHVREPLAASRGKGEDQELTHLLADVQVHLEELERLGVIDFGGVNHETAAGLEAYHANLTSRLRRVLKEGG